MGGQRVVPLEGFATVFANEGCFIGMLRQVLFPPFARGKSQVTKGAKIGFVHVGCMFGNVNFSVFLGLAFESANGTYHLSMSHIYQMIGQALYSCKKLTASVTSQSFSALDFGMSQEFFFGDEKHITLRTNAQIHRNVFFIVVQSSLFVFWNIISGGMTVCGHHNLLFNLNLRNAKGQLKF